MGLTFTGQRMNRLSPDELRFFKQDLEQTQDEPPHEDMWQDWSEELRAIDIDLPVGQSF